MKTLNKNQKQKVNGGSGGTLTTMGNPPKDSGSTQQGAHYK